MIDMNVFALLVLMVVLPLLPAFLLFKYLPSSSASLTGPLQHFTVNLGGAIAGYAFILLVLLYAFRSVLPGNFKEWNVKGKVFLNDQAGAPGQAHFRLIPGFEVDNEGNFFLTVYAPRQSKLPDLLILEDRYITQTRDLKTEKPDQGQPPLFNLGTITLERDPRSTTTPTQQEPLAPKN
jgi:hypothetical protein